MKKILSLTLVFVFIFISAALGQGTDEIAQVLNKFNSALDKKLNEINAQVESAARELATVIYKEAEVRRILNNLCQSNQPYVIDAVFIDLDGAMDIIEPEEYRKFEDMDVSIQKNGGMAFNWKKPGFSNVFRAVEGMDAINFHHPIISPKGAPLGVLSILLKPYDLLRLVIMPVIKDTDVDIWVMQQNGLIIFDSDEKEVGKNVFSDDYFKPFHSLLAICQRIAHEEKGAAVYEFFATGQDKAVKKNAVWNTVRMHGTEWSVVYYEVVE